MRLGTRVRKSDDLIKYYGNLKYKKRGPKHAVVIQANMRQLGRPTQLVNSEIVGPPISLSTAIDGMHFDKLLHATEVLCSVGVDDTWARHFQQPFDWGTNLLPSPVMWGDEEKSRYSQKRKRVAIFSRPLHASARSETVLYRTELSRA